VLVTGATGNVPFAVLGLVLSLPLLRHLYRRFGTWKAPALDLAIFTMMFSLSAFVIAPPSTATTRDRDRTARPHRPRVPTTTRVITAAEVRGAPFNEPSHDPRGHLHPWAGT
jgi:hypothetical protein